MGCCGSSEKPVDHKTPLIIKTIPTVTTPQPNTVTNNSNINDKNPPSSPSKIVHNDVKTDSTIRRREIDEEEKKTIC